MNTVIVLILAITALLIILIIFVPKFKFFGDVGGCVKSGGTCVDSSTGCAASDNQYQAPLSCPKDEPTDPDRVCCLTRVGDD